MKLHSRREEQPLSKTRQGRMPCVCLRKVHANRFHASAATLCYCSVIAAYIPRQYDSISVHLLYLRAKHWKATLYRTKYGLQAGRKHCRHKHSDATTSLLGGAEAGLLGLIVERRRACGGRGREESKNKQASSRVYCDTGWCASCTSALITRMASDCCRQASSKKQETGKPETSTRDQQPRRPRRPRKQPLSKSLARLGLGVDACFSG